MVQSNDPEFVKVNVSQPSVLEPSKKVEPGDDIRRTIASNVANRFESMDLDVNTDKKTGSITLFLDESFLFLNNSFQLREAVKDKLKLVIPAYTEELFKDAYVRNNIASINIIGHASPRYMGQAVDPDNTDYQAYEYNLMLSSNRALQITKYVVGEQIGNYRFKEILRKKVKPSGQSYMHPLELKAGERKDRDCGKYSCKRSRRVEISFSLVEDNEKSKEAVDAVRKKRVLRSTMRSPSKPISIAKKIDPEPEQIKEEEPKSAIKRFIEVFTFSND